MIRTRTGNFNCGRNVHVLNSGSYASHNTRRSMRTIETWANIKQNEQNFKANRKYRNKLNDGCAAMRMKIKKKMKEKYWSFSERQLERGRKYAILCAAKNCNESNRFKNTSNCDDRFTCDDRKRILFVLRSHVPLYLCRPNRLIHYNEINYLKCQRQITADHLILCSRFTRHFDNFSLKFQFGKSEKNKKKQNQKYCNEKDKKIQMIFFK